MKRKISFLLAVTMLLSGCNTVDKAEQTTTEVTASPNNNVCYDYYGNEIDVTDSEDDGVVVADGYIYAAISDGQVWNSLESPEIFNQDSIDLRIAERDSYSKLYVNDSVNCKNGTLVLTQAETGYWYNPVQNDICFISSHAWFSGELSMKGYITLGGNNTIVFLPGNGEWNGLPMIYYETKTSWLQENSEIISNAPIITLENWDDYINSNATLRDSLQEVYVTISNLELCWIDGDYGIGVNTAEIVDISYL